EDGQPAPAVILLPTALTDRNIYLNIERMLLAGNIAFLNLEYRGIGKSVNKGVYVNQTFSEIMGGRRDVHDAYNLLASQQGIDPDRIGVLGSILGAKYALYSAKENPRIRAIGMLDPVVWAWDEANDHEAVNTVGRPVLLVTGSGMGELTRRFAELVRRNNQNSVLSYPGATVA